MKDTKFKMNNLTAVLMNKCGKFLKKVSENKLLGV